MAARGALGPDKCPTCKSLLYVDGDGPQPCLKCEAMASTFAELRFIPQQWIGDYATEVAGNGELRAKVPLEEVVMEGGTLPDALSYDTDQLRLIEGVPAWWAKWDGPFEVEIMNRDECEKVLAGEI